MNGTQTHALPNQAAKTTAFQWLAGSSIFEASGALAVIALSIVGLAGVFSLTMAAISTIILGAAILIESGTLAALSERFSTRTTGSERGFFSEPVGLDFLGGMAAIVLGILALLGTDPQTLLSVAVLVLGASFLFGYQGVIGLAGVILGILAVIGVAPLTLVLVGLLSLGIAALVGGGYTATRALTTAQAS